MKIVFVEPASPELHVYKEMAMPRMGSLYLATILQNAGHQVRVFCEDIKAPSADDLLEADVVCLSTITATAPRAYEFAGWLRDRGVRTVIGGPHVTFLPEEAAEHVDVVSIGEAENSILPLMEALEGKMDLAQVPGIAYMKDGKVCRTAPSSPIADLDELPSVNFNILEGGLQKALYNTIIPVMTSRGCPYNCNFCSVTEMFGRKYRFRSPEKVIEDIKMVKDAARYHIFFYDDHFTAHRGRTVELMERMIEEKFGCGFSAQVRIELGKDAELLALMKKAGLDTVYVGFESINPETLKSYDKGQTVEQMKEAIRGFRKAGVRIHGMFVFGGKNDTVETIRETVHFAKENRIGSVQFLILTPIAGTRFYRDVVAEDRLATKYWALFDGHHVTYEPKMMTAYELQYETFKAMRDFYSFRACIEPLLKFQFVDAGIRFYGRKLVRKWTYTHRNFLDEFHSSWRTALTRLETEWRTRLSAVGMPIGLLANK